MFLKKEIKLNITVISSVEIWQSCSQRNTAWMGRGWDQ